MRVCVFCGSRVGALTEYAKEAETGLLRKK